MQPVNSPARRELLSRLEGFGTVYRYLSINRSALINQGGRRSSGRLDCQRYERCGGHHMKSCSHNHVRS